MPTEIIYGKDDGWCWSDHRQCRDWAVDFTGHYETEKGKFKDRVTWFFRGTMQRLVVIEELATKAKNRNYTKVVIHKITPPQSLKTRDIIDTANKTQKTAINKD